TTDTAMALDPTGINIIGGMNNDRPLSSQVIDARLQAIHAQGIAVLAEVAFLGAEQADARMMAALDIGEVARQVIARALAVGDQILQHQRPGKKIEDP